MYQPRNDAKLRSGQTVQCGVVAAPDAEWSERLTELLGHKGGIWNWQNAQTLNHALGIDVHYHILHRDGQPFANVMAAALNGVGILGHVWTAPDDRRQNAAMLLMQQATDHFRAHNGRSLFLGTDYDSPAYHIYRRSGFKSVEDCGGCMAWYASSPDQFDAAHFADGPTTIEPIDWPHWPVSAALGLCDSPGVVRFASMHLFGRNTTEGTVLGVLRRQQERGPDAPPCAMVLSQTASTTVVGISTWDWHPLWPDTCIVDVYCHAQHWRRAGELLEALSLPAAGRCVAYADPICAERRDVLTAAGFQPISTMPQRLAANATGTQLVDVLALERA